MKNKNIINICKKSGFFMTFFKNSQQWISDSFACYPIKDIPNLSEEMICAMYDISDKAREKIIFSIGAEAPENIDFSDVTDDEVLVEAEALSINWAGKKLVPFKTSRGICFVDSKYLSPFDDIQDNIINVYERTAKKGNTYLVVKSGLLIIGVIMPFAVPYDEFALCLERMAKLCGTAYDNAKN